MIPKIIHLTWFGTDPYPRLVKKCIDSWKKKLPDYEIYLWNSQNFDMDITPWVRQAYDAKKYAFVSDYARFYLLFNYGGIYLDSDVEILRNLDELLNEKAFVGMMTIKNIIEAEVIGSEVGNPLFGKILKYYESRNFIRKDGSYNQQELPKLLYTCFVKAGMKPNSETQDIENIHIYPAGYFVCHADYENMENIPRDAYTIHYGAGFGWRSNNPIIETLLRLYTYNFIEIIKYLDCHGLIPLWKFCFNKIRWLYKYVNISSQNL